VEGTGAVIITVRHIPASMVMTDKIGLLADGVADPEPLSDPIDGTIGQGSLFNHSATTAMA
jgi:hypothetical protein